MKKSLSIILMILVGGLFIFTSCEDDETVDPGTNPKATIQGYVHCDFDLSNADFNEDNPPVGTKVFFRIDAADLVLNPNANFDYQTLQYETTLDADGFYSISVPTAKHAAVAVDIQVDQFMEDQINGGGSNQADVYFATGVVTVNTMAGQTHHQDINF